MKMIKDIGERALLELFRELVDQGELPFNDDAVAYELSDGKLLVVNIDTLVESTDVPKGMTPYQIGAKATTMAISDLAAKGVQPLFTIASGSFPNTYKVDDTYNLVKGISEISHEMGAKYLGGDTNESDEIVLSIVSLGITNKNQLIKRHGAQNGDIICTTGKFGLTGAGFRVFLEDFSATEIQNQAFHSAIYQPKARLKEGLFLRDSGKISACTDSSDGLAWCLRELIRDNSEIGIVITCLPIDPLVVDFSLKHNLVAEDLALYGGEEFELVFTIHNSYLKTLMKKAKSQNVEIYQIGEVTSKNPGKIFLKKNQSFIEIIGKGWQHFK